MRTKEQERSKNADDIKINQAGPTSYVCLLTFSLCLQKGDRLSKSSPSEFDCGEVGMYVSARVWQRRRGAAEHNFNK